MTRRSLGCKASRRLRLGQQGETELDGTLDSGRSRVKYRDNLRLQTRVVWLCSAPAGIFTVRGNRARCDSARGGRQSVGRRASRHKYLQRVGELVKTASWADKASGARPRDASDCANFIEQVKTASWAGNASGARPRDASDCANLNEQVKTASWLDKASGARPRDACD